MDISHILNDLSVIITVSGGAIYAIKALNSKLHFSDTKLPIEQSIFPISGEPIVVTTGVLNSKEYLDPEDRIAAFALLKCFYGMLSRDKLPKIVYLDEIPRIGTSKHVVAVGGPYSNPITKHLAFMPPFRQKPLVPIFLLLDPSMTLTASRKFNGKKHSRPIWSVVDKLGDKQYFPLTDENGWLQRDYLLLTVQPLKKENEENRFIAFMGLYGTGVMAVEVLLRNEFGILNIIDECRKKSPYFQSLIAVENIDHSGKFSIADTINHIVTYPLFDNY